jgi:hypothetical protein
MVVFSNKSIDNKSIDKMRDEKKPSFLNVAIYRETQIPSKCVVVAKAGLPRANVHQSTEKSCRSMPQPLQLCGMFLQK